MAKEILDAEQLDNMWPTDATSEPDYADRMTRIEDSRRELRNQRTPVKTLDDALDAYDGLVADAYKTRELGLDGQASALKAIGRADTGNTQEPKGAPRKYARLCQPPLPHLVGRYYKETRNVHEHYALVQSLTISKTYSAL